jgi:hypothetical protein
LSRHVLAGAIVAVASASVLATAHVGQAATAATASTTYTIKATLNTGQEVPKPRDAVHAKGTLTGKLTLAGKKSRFTWTLKLSHLSGRVRAAEIAMGARGKVGITMLPLCNKCRLTSHGAYIGPYVDNKPFVKALLHGHMYVNVTTKLNPKGEIRGQIKATAA